MRLPWCKYIFYFCKGFLLFNFLFNTLLSVIQILFRAWSGYSNTFRYCFFVWKYLIHHLHPWRFKMGQSPIKSKRNITDKWINRHALRVDLNLHRCKKAFQFYFAFIWYTNACNSNTLSSYLFIISLYLLYFILIIIERNYLINTFNRKWVG